MSHSTSATPVPVQEQRQSKRPGPGLHGKSTLPPTFEASKWRPGQSGNPSGRRKDNRSLRAALQRVATRADLEQIARRLLSDAKRGGVRSTRIVCELLGDLGGRGTSVVVEAPIQMAQQCVVVELPVLEGQAEIDERAVAAWRERHAAKLTAAAPAGLPSAAVSGNGGNGGGRNGDGPQI